MTDDAQLGEARLTNEQVRALRQYDLSALRPVITLADKLVYFAGHYGYLRTDAARLSAALAKLRKERT